jgi:aspartate/glutamate racemase
VSPTACLNQAKGRSLPRTKHIGIVACSAEGAALCYRTICREALEVVGKNDHPRITMDSIPLALWMPSFDQRDYRGVAQLMLESARVLATAGADFAICPDNSAHLAWKHVMAETPIPWLHIATVLGEEAQRLGYQRIGVLGTRFTMDGPVYRDTLTSMGIESVVPAREDRETVDRVIFNELVDGIVTDDSRREYNAVIARLAPAGRSRQLAPADPGLDAPARPRRSPRGRQRLTAHLAMVGPSVRRGCAERQPGAPAPMPSLAPPCIA